MTLFISCSKRVFIHHASTTTSATPQLQRPHRDGCEGPELQPEKKKKKKKEKVSGGEEQGGSGGLGGADIQTCQPPND